MSQYSERSQELANELRAKAIGNLAKQGHYVSRSARSGKFVTPGYAKNHPSTSVSSKAGRELGATKIKKID